MNDERDPFEILREINPVDPNTLPDPACSQAALEGLERIVGGEVAPSEARHPRRLRALRPVRRRRVYVVPAVAVTVVALAAGTLAWALTRGPTQHLSIGCYAAVDLEARTVVVPAHANSPIESCEQVWRAGEFGKPPPPLEACVLPSGAVGVFPSPEGGSCARLSLPPAPAEPASPLVELEDTVVDTFLGRCVSESEARRIVIAEMRRLGLGDWRVTTSGTFDSSRPCASLAFDEARSEVLLVPIPR